MKNRLYDSGVRRWIARWVGRPISTFAEQDGVSADTTERHLEALRGSDDEENEASEPPEDEAIELHCIWVTECYGPSHIGDLISGIQQLEWDEQGNSRLLPGKITGWIEKARTETTGSIELGHIVRPGDTRWAGDRRESDLPPEVDYAQGRLECPYLGLVVLSMQFVLKDDAALYLDNALRQQYETIAIPRHRGTSYLTPGLRKREAVEERRAELRRNCASWFAEYIPGMFHGGTTADERFPTCELLTIQKAQPFVSLPGEQMSSPKHHLYNYLSLLQLDQVANSYESSSLPGLLLRPGATGETGLSLLIAGRKSSLQEHPHYTLHAEYEPERIKIAGTLDITVSGVMLVWSLHALLRNYERILADIESRVGAVDLTKSEDAARQVASLRSELLTISRDVVPLSLGLGRLAEHSNAFRWRTGEFMRAFAAPVETDWAFTTESTKEPSIVDRLKSWFARLNSHEKQIDEFEVPSPPQQRMDLLENVRLGIANRSSRLRETEADLRQVTTTIGSMVDAVVQERATRTSLRLQRWVVILTVVLTILTFVTTAVAAGQLRSVFTDQRSDETQEQSSTAYHQGDEGVSHGTTYAEQSIKAT